MRRTHDHSRGRTPGSRWFVGALVAVAGVCAGWVFVGATPTTVQTPPTEAPAPPSTAEAGDPEVERALAALERRCAEVHDLTARFEEQKYTSLLKEPLVSRGTVRMAGGRVRWDAETPRRVVTLIDRREVRIYYRERKTVEVYEVGAHMPVPNVSPLPRPAELREHFRIEPASSEDTEHGCAAETCLALRLTPRDAALSERITAIDVWVDRASALLRRAELVDPDGDRTVWVFTDVRVNTGLTERDLALDVPPGTRESRLGTASRRESGPAGAPSP
jgi:outer membrane lipoprotein-sorting protein